MGKHMILYHIWNNVSYQIWYVMSNSEKILKTISNLIESGVLSSKDLKKEISNELRFKKDKIIDKLELVSRQEFEVLKKLVQKQDATIKKILKKKLKR